MDPENDPVVFTTDYGLDIKWHLTGYKEDPSTLDKISSGKFKGYAYITAGGVNWAIIGYSSNITASITGKINIVDIISKYSGMFSEFSDYSTDSIWQMLDSPDTTDAGAEIYDVYTTVDSYVYNKSAATAVYSNPASLFPNAKAITDTNILATDEILCFAQTLLPNTNGAVKFGSSNNYNGSNLKNYCDTWYTSNLQSSLVGPYIQEQTELYTLHYNSHSTVTAKLFPLAGRSSSESFYYGAYMSAGPGGNMDVDATWWLRSGDGYASNGMYGVNDYGYVSSGYNNGYGVTRSFGVRPAFVLKI